ncbi:uncharacterized protein HMPREF1541_07555 [Cyphellophora europaea CBS 101466]|uniref:U3 small nucleolar RNA-associated protein 22 n=1 Tax=Cyphellophora europaea (strain CBS 101466) TaxID=1220924 RepID=W2RNA7_CYPE1|nr:uncharacterized protein HMPREF1541_07555 [Cyphellophora europaea CBS 101466]ETN37932.1 hypothetical protein HMPREF1541_07555 [Cyphellophora europaea CBS 101466]
MSRKSHTSSAPKRRKLSHSSDDEIKHDRFAVLNGNTSSSEHSGGDESGDEVPETSAPSKLQQHTRRRTQRPSAALPAGGAAAGSLLTAQISELLAENTPNYDLRHPKITKVTEVVVRAIKALPQQGPFNLVEAEKYALEHGKVAIPFPSPRPSKDSNVKYEYAVPAAITTRSRTVKRMSIKGSEEVVIGVQMPASLLQEKDYLNLRAFHKRAFYLARIAGGLSEALRSDFTLQYECLDGLDLVPAVILTQNVKATKSRTTRYFISVEFPQDAFQAVKTLPNKNCVRSTQQPASGDALPTPFYNSCLQRQASQNYYDDLVAAATSRCPAVPDASKLGQLWLAQRGFGTNLAQGGFGWWEWSIMCALLLQTGGPRGQPLFSERYSSLQLFKAMVQVLATRELTEPWLLRSDTLDIAQSEVPMLYDGKTGVNVLFKMTGASYQHLRHCAQLSLTTVNSKQEDSFDSTFIRRYADPCLQFDEIHTMDIGSHSNAPTQNDAVNKLFRVLKRGLGDRVTLLDIQRPFPVTWKISTPSPKARATSFQVRLLVNPDTVSRLVDHGPSAEDQAAATEFQQFWGSKSELRRFKDGSITESLVWDSSEPVTLQIIRHLLQRHFSADPKLVATGSSRLDENVLPVTAVSAKDAFTLINQKFQALTSTLHSLSDLPLPIRSVSAASSALRSTTLAPPLSPSTATPISILIQFDSSGRWPDSLPAIQHTKIAFLLKLGDALSTADTTLTTRVGLEHTSTATTGHFNTAYLDLIYPSPAPTLAPLIFRLRIHHDRELHLLQTALSDDSLHGAIRDSLTSALAAHKRDFLASPRHTTAFRTLLTRFPALSPTIRLLKKWTSSHLLSRHVPEEILELIAAHIFVHPAPWATPASPTTAFLRCLWFLSTWDWAVSPLIVDLSVGQEMGAEQTAELRARFAAWRKLDPQMNQVSWFVGSNVDETGVAWTAGGRVEKVVAARVAALAGACLEVVGGQTAAGLSLEVGKTLFVSPFEEYDFLVMLDKEAVKGAAVVRRKGKEKYRNLEVAAETDVDVVGFDPVEDFLADLEAAFGNTALFFYGASGDGGKILAGVWRPGVQGRREWRVRLGWSSVPISDKVAEDDDDGKEMCEFNKMGILKEMEIIGEGLVKEIKVQT